MSSSPKTRGDSSVLFLRCRRSAPKNSRASPVQCEPGQCCGRVRLRAGSRRFTPSRLTDLVGRDEECELLVRRWSKAKTGEGQVVLLSGEAGIGKSRLTAALMERLTTEPHTRLRYFCSPQHTDSAFYPIIGQLERVARLAHDDSPTAKLDKLDALLAETSTSKQDAALLAELLSLPNDGRFPTLDLAPQQRRQKTIEALILQVEVLTRLRPVLMIFEDAHWVDPSSLELLSRTLDRIAAFRVLLIVTSRPEFEPPWIGRPYVTALTINRLGNREVEYDDRPHDWQQATSPRASGKTLSIVLMAFRCLWRR